MGKENLKKIREELIDQLDLQLSFIKETIKKINQIEFDLDEKNLKELKEDLKKVESNHKKSVFTLLVDTNSDFPNLDQINKVKDVLKKNEKLKINIENIIFFYHLNKTPASPKASEKDLENLEKIAKSLLPKESNLKTNKKKKPFL